MPKPNATRPRLPDLPVLAAVDALHDALRDGHAVLSAAPGSGKTTLVPLALLDADWLAGRRIVMLEPRRPAARMAARRMAALLGEAVGDTVGYQVRFERRVGPTTRIEILTEGLLLRRLQADPELAGVGLLIFDEFHERSLRTDLALALGLDVAGGLRDDLRLLLMSASLDARPVADLIDGTHIDTPGAAFPVSVTWSGHDTPLRDPVTDCLRLLGRALDEGDGDVLVFLPGRREIEALRAQALEVFGQRAECLTLFGDMASDAQDRVLRGEGSGRRVILATDIAETSLTIPGVTAIVDSGLARKPAFDPNTGLTRLQTRRISKASALQRTGRAGRLGPGRCYRAWTAARHARLDDWTAPEITTADLAAPVLELAAWGVTDPGGLQWLDAPPRAHWDQAVDLLRQLGALDDSARITARGRRMTRFPTHPRLARLLAGAHDMPTFDLAADLAALVSERDPMRGGPARPGADIEVRLRCLVEARDRRPLPAGCDRLAVQRIDRAARQFRRLADEGVGDVPATAVPEPGELIARAFADRVALCTSADGLRYRMRNGRAALLDPDDPLRGAPALAIASLDAGERDGRVWLAAALRVEQIEALFAATIVERRELSWNEALGDVTARRVRRLDALVLRSEPVGLDRADPVADIIMARIRERGLTTFFADAPDLRARVMLAAASECAASESGARWPDFSEAGLLASLEDWLLPWLRQGEGVRQLKTLKLQDMLLARLDHRMREHLDHAFPTHFVTPAGTRRRIEYPVDGQPRLALPLQEVLGLQRGPSVARGNLPVVLHLLSPAGRPLQVTADLEAFWNGAYAEVKKEMRGRYPKHYWPDDPAAACATRFTKRRM